MKSKLYSTLLIVCAVLLAGTVKLAAQTVPVLYGPAGIGMQEVISAGITTGIVYTTDPGQTNYVWNVSGAGTITDPPLPADRALSNTITVTWTDPVGNQSVSVSYDGSVTTTLVINYYPYPAPIDPTVIPQFVDPLPHFAAGLRVNAQAGGNIVVKAELTQQVALSTGTPVTVQTPGGPVAGVIGTTPGAGLGNYVGYGISTDGVNFGPVMWPAQTIEARQGFPLQVQYQNNLFGVRYSQFNILADQTLMMHGFQLTGDPLTMPYDGDIPMVTHLHGGEMPSGSDGGPNSWFMPGYSLTGPGFQYNASSLASYPNMQEATTLWYHPHDDGLTRINVYTGLAGYYFLRGADEETAQVPGWSGDGRVQEVSRAGEPLSPFSAVPYLPEVEIAIQDRMFNEEGELYWPVAPPNPDIHPFWTPEFVGDVMTVNGKSWPFLSVAPRKYRFRILEGCNARFLNMWLVNASDGTTPGPVITVIGGEGGLLSTPVNLDPALGQTLLIAPGQRYDVIIDFTGLAGQTFTLMNNANTPFPFGDPVVAGLTDRVMQFVVNGTIVGADNSVIPANLRPVNPLIQLTDFAGNLSAGVTPDLKRQIILNEVMGPGGPASVLVNNTYFDGLLAIPGTNPVAGGPTELQTEGTTEIVQVINVSADAHPIHIHLLQWQLVSRQDIDDIGYLAAYSAAWAGAGGADFPAGQGYPGGSGPPFPYSIPNAEGALGGNPPLTGFYLGAPIPANPEERGWKDNIIVYPAQVTTFAVRVAPTDRPLNASQNALLFPFDPSEGPGYVWHCHIIDHEDMSMMRPLPIIPSPARRPQITAQPIPVVACAGDAVTFTVTPASPAGTTFQWEVSTNGGATWSALTNVAPYAGVLTATLSINPAAIGLDANRYRCVLTNNSGPTSSDGALLTVNDCSIAGTLTYNNAGLTPLAGFTVTAGGLTAVTGADGSFIIPGVMSGVHPVTVTPPVALLANGINSTDALGVSSWALLPVAIPNVKFLAGDVDNTTLIDAMDAQAIQQNFAQGKAFIKAPWVFSDAAGITTVNPPALSVTVPGNAVAGFNILGMCTGDFNSSYGANVSNISYTNTGVILNLPGGKQFDLPINAGTAMSVGAVSITLNVPSNLVSVKNVKIQGATGPVTYKVTGNVLKIGWNSTTPVATVAGQPFIVLTLLPTASFTGTATLTVSMVADPLNEIVDATLLPVLGASLLADDVRLSSTTTSTLTISASPNPARTTTDVTYTTPVDGTVSITIYNSLGSPVLTVLSPTYTIAGTYTLTGVNVVALAKGTYYMTISLDDGINPLLTKSIKFMKK